MIILNLITGVGAFNNWGFSIFLQSVFSVLTAWGLIYLRDPRWVNWRNRIFRKNQPVLNVPEPVGVKKKKKPLGEIEKLRNKYGGK